VPRKSKSEAGNKRLRNLLSSLVLYERIITTQDKARQLKKGFLSIINKIKKAKKNISRTKFANKIFYGGAAKKIINEIETYKTIRTYNYKARSGDGSIQTIVEIEKEVKKASNKDNK